MDRVLVIGRIRPECRGDVAVAFEGPVEGVRLFRQGDTLVLLVEGRHADARFLHLIEDGAPLAPVIACLEEVPLLPPELRLSNPDQAAPAPAR